MKVVKTLKNRIDPWYEEMMKIKDSLPQEKRIQMRDLVNEIYDLVLEHLADEEVL